MKKKEKSKNERYLIFLDRTITLLLLSLFVVICTIPLTLSYRIVESSDRTIDGCLARDVIIDAVCIQNQTTGTQTCSDERVETEILSCSTPQLLESVRIDGEQKTLLSPNGTISTFTVEIGDRNLAEYGECRDFEISRGVCTLT